MAPTGNDSLRRGRHTGQARSIQACSRSSAPVSRTTSCAIRGFGSDGWRAPAACRTTEVRRAVRGPRSLPRRRSVSHHRRPWNGRETPAGRAPDEAPHQSMLGEDAKFSRAGRVSAGPARPLFTRHRPGRRDAPAAQRRRYVARCAVASSRRDHPAHTHKPSALPRPRSGGSGRRPGCPGTQTASARRRLSATATHQRRARHRALWSSSMAFVFQWQADGGKLLHAMPTN